MKISTPEQILNQRPTAGELARDALQSSRNVATAQSNLIARRSQNALQTRGDVVGFNDAGESIVRLMDGGQIAATSISADAPIGLRSVQRTLRGQSYIS